MFEFFRTRRSTEKSETLSVPWPEEKWPQFQRAQLDTQELIDRLRVVFPTHRLLDMSDMKNFNSHYLSGKTWEESSIDDVLRALESFKSELLQELSRG